MCREQTKTIRISLSDSEMALHMLNMNSVQNCLLLRFIRLSYCDLKRYEKFNENERKNKSKCLMFAINKVLKWLYLDVK